jgi:heparan-alpha-glucosaminide N-acetyltransferase
MSWIEWTEDKFRGLNLRNLKADRAFLNVTNQVGRPIFLYSLSEECEKCPFSRLENITHAKKVLKIDTSVPLELKVFYEDAGKYVFDNKTADCYYSTNMGQFGVYDLIVKPSDCQFVVAKEPVNIYYCKLSF